MQSSYFVKAVWDAEASVWTSESDIPGLVIEANTLAEFESLMVELAPEMLAANVPTHPDRVRVALSATAQRELAIV